MLHSSLKLYEGEKEEGEKRLFFLSFDCIYLSVKQLKPERTVYGRVAETSAVDYTRFCG